MTFDEPKIGAWLKTWLWANQKDIQWLCKALGVSDNTALLLTKDRGVNLKNIRRLSQVTGTDLTILFLSREAQAIYHKGRKLMEEEKAATEKTATAVPQVQHEQIQFLVEEIKALKAMVAGKLGEGN
jgi:DNA-binding transcriptional MerR regulator